MDTNYYCYTSSSIRPLFSTSIVYRAIFYCLAYLIPTSTAISCFNFTSLDGQFSSSSTVNGCLACMRYTTMYNSGSVKYTMFQWACSLQPSASTGMNAPGSAGSMPQCISSTTVVTYADRSLYNKACTCCTNLCNGDDFCQPTPNHTADSTGASSIDDTQCNTSNVVSNIISLTVITILSTLFLLSPIAVAS